MGAMWWGGVGDGANDCVEQGQEYEAAGRVREEWAREA